MRVGDSISKGEEASQSGAGSLDLNIVNIYQCPQSKTSLYCVESVKAYDLDVLLGKSRCSDAIL